MNSNHKRSHLATTLLLPKVISKIVIELEGIRMAAIKGDKCPCTAKNNPAIL